MNWIDWTLVVVLNGAIIWIGVWVGRKTKTSTDWFLASRRIPWWMIGLSCYATAIDSSDLIADAGGIYWLGVSYFVTNWVGVVLGWFLAAHFIAIPMYRAGMYTNAEYLEARFCSSTRVISALVQTQYRTLVLGIMGTTMYYLLAIVCGWGPQAWWAVVAMVLLASIYTTLGGLWSVAVTDSMQTVLIVVGMLVLFLPTWNKVGGWAGMEQRLGTHDPELPAQMLQVGHDHIEQVAVMGPEEMERQLRLGGQAEDGRVVRRTPAWLVTVAFVIMGLAYPIVNHTQIMRMCGARSEWDLKMSVIPAAGLMLAFTMVNFSMGIMGRALYPEPSLMPLEESLRKADSIYPLLVRELTGAGVKGLVVTGVLAASFSTYDSIGSAVSALLTRDVYARLFVRNRDDRHYLAVSRWLTPIILFGSFLYVPFLLQSGMLLFYLELVASFVVPLLTIYLMGVFTRAHRRSGVLGLGAGVLYGIWRLVAAKVVANHGVLLMPPWMIGSYAAYLISMTLTAGTMIGVSMFLGWEKRGELLHREQGGWLQSSQEKVMALARPTPRDRGSFLPLGLGLALVLIGAWLSFVVFW